MVSLFNWFGKGKKSEISGKNPDEMTEKGLDAQLTRTTRQLKEAKLKYLRGRLEDINRKYEEMLLEDEIASAEDNLAELTGQDEDENDDNPDDMFMKLISNVMPRLNNSTHQAGLAVNPTLPTETTITDEELRFLKSQIPQAHLSRMKAANDAELTAFIQKYKPDFDAETTSRAIRIIRE